MTTILHIINNEKKRLKEKEKKNEHESEIQSNSATKFIIN